MPPDDGVWLHDQQRAAPVSPALREGHPKKAVVGPEASSLRRAAKGRQLLPQGEVLQDEFLMAAERQRQCADDDDEEFQHAPIVAGVGAKINGDEFWRTSPRDP
jgi:hypothetical protein